MKILVVADTHKNYAALKAAIDKNLDADMLIHLGDGEHEFADVNTLYPQMPMVYVGGNCDFNQHKTTHIVHACGYKIFCCHGHTMGVHDGLELLVSTAKREGCKIALFGHTHLYRTEIVDGVFVMNPGSLDSPRNHNKPTFGVIELSETGDIKMNIMAMEPK
ncbi:MAG: YfcE family phosphodiesterase [Oscillospiraceae bacterium]|nr:YfcE family phosphodiesterase [Oscillospiraceae bacterium]